MTRSHFTAERMVLLAVSCGILAVVLSSILAQPPAAQHPWMDKSLPPDRRANLVLQQMTLDEKIRMVH